MKIYKFFFLCLSLLLIFIIYEKFPKYINQEKFIKFFFISIFLFFALLSSFINKKYRKNINIFFIYFVIITYSLNLLLSLNYYYNSTEYEKKKVHKELKIDFDYRDPLTYIKDYKNHENMLILSGIPNAKYIQCNEFGEWKKIITDNLGFNNSSIDSKYNVLLTGDSFAFGVCV